MALRVMVAEQPNHKRSEIVCRAMLEGIKRVGDVATLVPSAKYDGLVKYDVAVFYGLGAKCGDILRDYSERATAVYIDLGYWGRKAGGRFIGYHKLSVNGRHPTAYFQKRRHDDSRMKKFGVVVRDWRPPGSYILLAGMGPKGSVAEGYGLGGWECEAIKTLRRVTDRPILYRPKPNWDGAYPLPGTIFSPPDSATLQEQAQRAHCVVSHHSNANVECLLDGVPSFTTAGVAEVLSLRDLEAIEAPIRPPGREQWAADIAWTQWSVEEMAEGLPWRHLKDEGLV